jgi:hypothetical protein
MPERRSLLALPLGLMALGGAARAQPVAAGNDGPRLQALGVRAQGSTPQQAQALLASELKRWSEVIANAKIEQQ